MDFTNDELIVIGRALLDAAGRLKADHLSRLCEAEPCWEDLKAQYDKTVALARRFQAEGKKRMASVLTEAGMEYLLDS